MAYGHFAQLRGHWAYQAKAFSHCGSVRTTNIVAIVAKIFKKIRDFTGRLAESLLNQPPNAGISFVFSITTKCVIPSSEGVLILGTPKKRPFDDAHACVPTEASAWRLPTFEGGEHTKLDVVSRIFLPSEKTICLSFQDIRVSSSNTVREHPHRCVRCRDTAYRVRLFDTWKSNTAHPS